MRYRYNRSCSCPRCRAHGFMGPAVLITIGVLFLLDQMGRAHWMDFSFTWPALLIVIGLIKLLEHSASTNGPHPARIQRDAATQSGAADPSGDSGILSISGLSGISGSAARLGSDAASESRGRFYRAISRAR